jgi:hypothetical protein
MCVAGLPHACDTGIMSRACSPSRFRFARAPKCPPGLDRLGEPGRHKVIAGQVGLLNAHTLPLDQAFLWNATGKVGLEKRHNDWRVKLQQASRTETTSKL